MGGRSQTQLDQRSFDKYLSLPATLYSEVKKLRERMEDVKKCKLAEGDWERSGLWVGLRNQLKLQVHVVDQFGPVLELTDDWQV